MFEGQERHLGLTLTLTLTLTQEPHLAQLSA